MSQMINLKLTYDQGAALYYICKLVNDDIMLSSDNALKVEARRIMRVLISTFPELNKVINRG
jgi:hypothetical protein